MHFFSLFICHFTLLQNHENDPNPAPGFSHFLCITWHVNMKYAWSDFLFIAIPVIQNKKILHYCHYWSLVSIVFEEHHNMSPKSCAPVLVGLSTLFAGWVQQAGYKRVTVRKRNCCVYQKEEWKWLLMFYLLFYVLLHT